MYAKTHGVRSRIQYGDYALFTHMGAQGLQGRRDLGRMVREVIIYRDAMDASANFQTPFDAAKIRQRRTGHVDRDIDRLRGGDGGEGVHHVMSTDKIPSDGPDIASLTPDAKAATIVFGRQNIPFTVDAETLYRGPATHF